MLGSVTQEAAIRYGIGQRDFSFTPLTLPPAMEAPAMVENLRVDWHSQFDNAPTLIIDFSSPLGDEIFDTFRFQVNHGFYFAERDGFVQWHYHTGQPEVQEGYGGRWTTITMIDGTERTLKGPWHVALNSEAYGFPPAVEVHYTVPTTWGNRMEYFGLGVTYPLLAGLIAKFRPGLQMARVSEYGGNTIQPLTKYGVPKAALRGHGDRRYPEFD